MSRRQPFHFGFLDYVLAETGNAPLDTLHRDVDAICRCADAARPLAERLGVNPPRPHIAGFSYTHVSTLGARIVFPPNSEPNVVPALREPEDIDALCEPDDYLSCGVAPERLRVIDALASRCADAASRLDGAEGPLTTAALLMGPRFFTLPYEDPERAHRLLDFVVESCLEYNRAVRRRFGESEEPRPIGICDDFAGMFPVPQFEEYVLPAWDRIYRGQSATERHLHSELLRPEHLRFLKGLDIATFDPSADQYVTPELLRERCPVPFEGRVQSWHIRDLSETQLEAFYRRIAACEPVNISFYMQSIAEEARIRVLLETARRLAA